MVKTFDEKLSQQLDRAQAMTESDDATRRKAGLVFKKRIENQIFELENRIREAEAVLGELRNE